MSLRQDDHGAEGPSLGQKLADVNWLLVLLLSLVACFGFAMLYSAANGNLQPWAGRQMTRFGAGLVLMLMVARCSQCRDQKQQPGNSSQTSQHPKSSFSLHRLTLAATDRLP